ncbi:MAG: helix-turn-helix domain-containing protein, partial [Patescibacteria group bacterium]
MKPKLSSVERQRILRLVLAKKISVTAAARQAQVSRVLIYKWVHNFSELSSFQNLARKTSVRSKLKQAVTPRKGTLATHKACEMSLKARALDVRLRKKAPVAGICRELGISKTIFYQWLARYQAAGSGEGKTFDEHRAFAGLTPNTPSIYRYSRQVTPAHEKLILALVSQHPDWSCRTIRKNLPHISGRPVIGHHGVQNVLRRLGLSTFTKRVAFRENQLHLLQKPQERRDEVRSVWEKFTPQNAPAPPPAFGKSISPQTSTPSFTRLLLLLIVNLLRLLFGLPFNRTQTWQSFLIAFSIPVGLSLCLAGFTAYLNIFITAGSIGIGVGYFFASLALFCGMFFF